MWSLKCEVHVSVNFRNIWKHMKMICTNNSHTIQGCWFNVNQYKTYYPLETAVRQHSQTLFIHLVCLLATQIATGQLL